MIKTREDFRNFLKGKTFPCKSMLIVDAITSDMLKDEKELLSHLNFEDASDAQIKETTSLLKTLIAKNSYIVMLLLISHLGIPENEIDMTVNPEITYNRKTRTIEVHKGIPDWLNLINEWSVSFDPPTSDAANLKDEEVETIMKKARSRSEIFMPPDLLKKLKKEDLEHNIFNMLM